MNPEDFRNGTAGQAIRHTKGYWAFIPAPQPPVLTWRLPLVSILSEAERNLGKLANLAGVLPTPHLLVQPFVRREAVISSRIEGTRASLSDLYTYEAHIRHAISYLFWNLQRMCKKFITVCRLWVMASSG